MIRFENLTVRYGRTIALHGIDLELEPGIVGIFGQNGSGKSTLLRTVAGLLRPASGKVTYNGHPVNASNEDWRRRIGYAGHQPGLYDHMNVIENITLFARLNGVASEAVDEIIDRLGLRERANDRVAALSAGFQRRVGVARAMVHRPQILLLDEPYANLDEESADRISDFVGAWHSDDRLALIATHGARRLKAFADRGLILRQGVVASYRPYDHE